MEHDEDVVYAEEFLALERTDKKDRVLTSSGRLFVKKNVVYGKCGTNYRNSTVTKTIMGKTVTLGKAYALVGVALVGPNIPIEAVGHDERLRIFKSVTYYALTEVAALRLFIKGYCSGSRPPAQVCGASRSKRGV